MASVAATPQKPETTVYANVTSRQTMMACHLSMPSVPSRILAIPRFTQPMMMMFTTSPR